MPNDYSDDEFIKLREKVQLLEIAVARLQEQELASDRALVLANQALQHSQQAANEWRKENIDQRLLYPTINKVDGQIATESSERKGLESRVVLLERAGSADTGRHSAFDAVWIKAALIISAVGTMFAIAYRAITGK